MRWQVILIVAWVVGGLEMARVGSARGEGLGAVAKLSLVIRSCRSSIEATTWAGSDTRLGKTRVYEP